jgi:3-dehydroquinate synthase
LDKKSVNDKIKFILAKGIGECELRDDISKSKVLEILNQFRG